MHMSLDGLDWIKAVGDQARHLSSCSLEQCLADAQGGMSECNSGRVASLWIGLPAICGSGSPGNQILSFGFASP